MTMHSQSPWRLDFTDSVEQVCRVRDADGNAIADIYLTDEDPEKAEKKAQANAHLVVNAPLLLQELESVRHVLAKLHDKCRKEDPVPAVLAVIALADFAIAKAKGVY